jgi:hypothetical protein
MEKIQKNLSETTTLMERNIKNIVSRGHELDYLTTMSDNLVQSSEFFVIKIIPWYKRCFYWIFSCWWFKKKAPKTVELVRLV